MRPLNLIPHEVATHARTTSGDEAAEHGSGTSGGDLLYFRGKGMPFFFRFAVRVAMIGPLCRNDTALLCAAHIHHAYFQ